MRNRELFKALYAKYYRGIVRFYTTRFRLSEEDAKDLAQDVFVRFYEAMDDYRGDAEWAFLETIARNVLYNSIRSNKTVKRHGVVVPIDEALGTRDASPPVDVEVANRQVAGIVRKRLRDAMAELSPAQRHALQLWSEGIPYKQIAKLLGPGTTVDAVKSRLRDARRQLKQRLGDEFAAMHLPDNLPEDE
jgi:RNA polymerase sigma factor (sigma-70 family)